MRSRQPDDGRRDRAVIRRVVDWFERNRRPLPWRELDSDGRRSAYAALVSEAMLQQTQVARVVDKYNAFVRRFPTVAALAGADVNDVLAAWSGLGYYRRARSLHAAAEHVVERFDGRLPRDVESLRTLPGVGRYTAGAIASVVFGEPAPIVDGNVARVLLRLDGVELDPASREGGERLWTRAEGLARRARRMRTAEVGAFNEGVMELGATVCAPRAPRCDGCPLATLCIARRTGRVERIPPPRRRVRRATIHHACVLVRDRRGQLLVEQRADGGLWGGLWQPPTLERADASPSARSIGAWIGGTVSLRERFDHLTTHRRVRFSVWRCDAAIRATAGRRWLAPEAIEPLALSNPHRRILLGQRADA